jgi:hypothetical protein
MLHRALKAKHFSRYIMGAVFLGCGLLLTMVNLLAGGVFLAVALLVFYYAPKWDLRIDLDAEAIHFSENVVETSGLRLNLVDVLEIRRVEEKETRKGFLGTYPDAYSFVEFETRAGKTYRMYDIFDEVFDDEMGRLGLAAGVRMDAFARIADV